MHKCNEDFLKRHNLISFNGLSIACDIRDLNEIVAKYEMQSNSEERKVSIANIYGVHDKMDEIDYSFPEILDYFFDEQGDGYHSRSVSMLDYNEENVIDGLESSFRIEPMILIEMDYNKYFVLTNGIHRFIVLKSLYLSAKRKCQNESEIVELNQRFTIPVKVTKVDFIKTYCKYLIDMFQPVKCMNAYFTRLDEYTHDDGTKSYELERRIGWNQRAIYQLNEQEKDAFWHSYTGLENEYDDNYKQTGRSRLVSFNRESTILTDEELIQFTHKIIIESNKNKEEIFDLLRCQANLYPSFKDFLQLYFRDIIDLGLEEVPDDNIER